MSANPKLPAADVEAISSIISEIAKRTSFDADCSRDVFEENELLPVDSIEDLLLRLNQAVQAVPASVTGEI